MYNARRRRVSARVHVRDDGMAVMRDPLRKGSNEVAEQQVHPHGIARVGEMPRPVEHDQLPGRQLREPGARGPRSNGVVAAVDDDHRAIDARQELAHALFVHEPRCELGRHERFGIRVESPRDAVLARFRGVRLGEALRKKNSRKSS